MKTSSGEKIYRWAVNWDGHDSCVTPCTYAYECDCTEHEAHYPNFSLARREVIKFHQEKARGHREAARSWRKQKKENWL